MRLTENTKALNEDYLTVLNYGSLSIIEILIFNLSYPQEAYYICLMIQMLEEPSSFSSMTVHKTCQICYLNYDRQDLQDLRADLICYRCWHAHIKAYVTQISYKVGSQIISPFEGQEPIDVCLALRSLRQEDSKELEEWLFKKYSSFTADIQKCPSESCDYVFTMDKCKWGAINTEKCPKCEMVLVQSISFNLKSIIGFFYFLFFTNKCPKCQIPIEKTTGCPHMSCPCGHHFCWYCLKDYFPNPNNLYSVHQPKQCAFIFLSKIIFKLTCVLGVVLTFLGNEVFQSFVSYTLIGFKYIFLALAIDLIIILNVVAVNQFIQRFQSRYYNFHENNPRYYIIFTAAFLLGNLIVLAVLYQFEILYLCAIIIIVELSIAGIGALTVYAVVYSIETWFEYIC